MNRVVRGSSLLIVTAIVAACAAQRDEGKVAARAGSVAIAAQDRPFDELAGGRILNALLGFRGLRCMTRARQGDGAFGRCGIG